MTSATAVFASDPPPASPQANGSDSNYKMIPVGGTKEKPVYMRVQKQKDLSQSKASSNSDDKYRPDQLNLGRTSTLANKSYGANSVPLAKNAETDKSSFVTKRYQDNMTAWNDPSSTGNTSAHKSTTGHAADGLDKSYATHADNSLSKAAVLPITTSDYDNRTADVGKSKVDVYSNIGLAPRQYLGPGAQKVPESVEIKENVVLSRMTGLPNRALSVDEVRELINHEAKPDTDAPVEGEPSKPLNDPDYKPAPLRPVPAEEEDKTEMVPSPGMMASPQAPENQEPLPTK